MSKYIPSGFKLSKTGKTAFFYSSSSILKSVVGTASGFIALLYITPEEIGVWQAFFIIITYANFVSLGIPDGLNREIPYLQGEGKEKEGLELASAAKFYSYICFGITIISLIVGGFLVNYYGQEKLHLYSFIGVLLILSIQFLYRYYVVLYRTNDAFKKFSYVNLTQGVLLILLFPLIIYYKMEGFILYKILNDLFFLFLLVIYSPIKVKPKYNLKYLIHLIKVGLPIYTMGYLNQLGKSFIKFAILYYGGTITLGLFAPVFAVINGVKILPTSLARFFYPRFSFQFGKTQDTVSLWKSVKNISIYLFIFLSIVFIPIIFLIPYVVEVFLPHYSESILPTQMVIISTILLSSFLGVYALNSIKAYKSRLILTIAYLFNALCFSFLLPIFIDNLLISIALAIIVTDLMNFVITFFIVRRKLLNPIKL